MTLAARRWPETPRSAARIRCLSREPQPRPLRRPRVQPATRKCRSSSPTRASTGMSACLGPRRGSCGRPDGRQRGRCQQSIAQRPVHTPAELSASPLERTRARTYAFNVRSPIRKSICAVAPGPRHLSFSLWAQSTVGSSMSGACLVIDRRFPGLWHPWAL